MEKKELDMEDWELIPDHDTFLGISLHSPKKGLHINPQMDYFVCPSQDSSPAEDPSMQCLQNPDQVFKDIGVVVPQPAKYVEPEVEDIKKMESKFEEEEEVEPEVEDIKKLESKFEEEEEEVKGDDPEELQKEEKKPKACCGFGGGIGALCSIGVAAATICVFVLGGRQQQKQQYQNQRLQFKIYADDKRMKQVAQQASRLNQAISVAVRGVPMSRAHISFGGYYEGI